MPAAATFSHGLRSECTNLPELLQSYINRLKFNHPFVLRPKGKRKLRKAAALLLRAVFQKRLIHLIILPLTIRKSRKFVTDISTSFSTLRIRLAVK